VDGEDRQGRDGFGRNGWINLREGIIEGTRGDV
jgi:hypothetical protein